MKTANHLKFLMIPALGILAACSATGPYTSSKGIPSYYTGPQFADAESSIEMPAAWQQQNRNIDVRRNQAGKIEIIEKQ